jgi:hypothetical protein
MKEKTMNDNEQNTQAEALGVDIGGVVIDRINDNTDTAFFSGNYLNTTAVPGAFEALARLVAERFGANVHFVSKCGPTIEGQTREWLEHHDVFARTGIPQGNLRFCRRRRDKAPIAEELGLTHFIDDRLEILGRLTTVPTRILFQPCQPEVERFSRYLGLVVRAESWAEVLALLL